MRDDSLDWTAGQWAVIFALTVMCLVPLIHFMRAG